MRVIDTTDLAMLRVHIAAAIESLEWDGALRGEAAYRLARAADILASTDTEKTA